MPIIESKCLTEIYEIRRRINQKIIDMSAEEQTAYFRRSSQAALAGRNLKMGIIPTPLGHEEEGRGEEVF